MTLLPGGQQEIETRDEYITVVKGVQIDAECWAKARRIEALVLDGVEIVTFDAGVQNPELGA